MLFGCGQIVLDSLMRVGDRVLCNPDTKSDSWGYKSESEKANVGKKGRVFGFYLFDSYEPNFGGTGQKPGVYQRRGVAVIRWDDGTGGRVSAFDLSWWPWAEGEDGPKDSVEAARAVCEHHVAMGKQRQAERPENESEMERVYLGELPKIPFYELDVVCDREGAVMQVCRINWEYFNDRRDDGSFMPLLTVRKMGSSGTTSADMDQVELVQGGNVRKWCEGKQDQIEFKGAEDEAEFYKGLGRYKQVRSKGNHFHWTIDEAVQALRDGVGDAIGMTSGMFGSARTPVVYKFDDAGPGARIRAHTLAGFQEQPA